jgi:hypothetical protein
MSINRSCNVQRIPWDYTKELFEEDILSWVNSLVIWKNIFMK